MQFPFFFRFLLLLISQPPLPFLLALPIESTAPYIGIHSKSYKKSHDNVWETTNQNLISQLTAPIASPQAASSAHVDGQVDREIAPLLGGPAEKKIIPLEDAANGGTETSRAVWFTNDYKETDRNLVAVDGLKKDAVYESKSNAASWLNSLFHKTIASKQFNFVLGEAIVLLGKRLVFDSSDPLTPVLSPQQIYAAQQHAMELRRLQNEQEAETSKSFSSSSSYQSIDEKLSQGESLQQTTVLVELAYADLAAFNDLVGITHGEVSRGMQNHCGADVFGIYSKGLNYKREWDVINAHMELIFNSLRGYMMDFGPLSDLLATPAGDQFVYKTTDPLQLRANVINERLNGEFEKKQMQFDDYRSAINGELIKQLNNMDLFTRKGKQKYERRRRRRRNDEDDTTDSDKQEQGIFMMNKDNNISDADQDDDDDIETPEEAKTGDDASSSSPVVMALSDDIAQQQQRINSPEEDEMLKALEGKIEAFLNSLTGKLPSGDQYGSSTSRNGEDSDAGSGVGASDINGGGNQDTTTSTIQKKDPTLMQLVQWHPKMAMEMHDLYIQLMKFRDNIIQQRNASASVSSMEEEEVDNVTLLTSSKAQKWLMKDKERGERLSKQLRTLYDLLYRFTELDRELLVVNSGIDFLNQVFYLMSAFKYRNLPLVCSSSNIANMKSDKRWIVKIINGVATWVSKEDYERYTNESKNVTTNGESSSSSASDSSNSTSAHRLNQLEVAEKLSQKQMEIYEREEERQQETALQIGVDEEDERLKDEYNQIADRYLYMQTIGWDQKQAREREEQRLKMKKAQEDLAKAVESASTSGKREKYETAVKDWQQKTHREAKEDNFTKKKEVNKEEPSSSQPGALNQKENERNQMASPPPSPSSSPSYTPADDDSLSSEFKKDDRDQSEGEGDSGGATGADAGTTAASPDSQSNPDADTDAGSGGDDDSEGSRRRRRRILANSMNHSLAGPLSRSRRSTNSADVGLTSGALSGSANKGGGVVTDVLNKAKHNDKTIGEKTAQAILDEGDANAAKLSGLESAMNNATNGINSQPSNNTRSNTTLDNNVSDQSAEEELHQSKVVKLFPPNTYPDWWTMQEMESRPSVDQLVCESGGYRILHVDEVRDRVEKLAQCMMAYRDEVLIDTRMKALNSLWKQWQEKKPHSNTSGGTDPSPSGDGNDDVSSGGGEGGEANGGNDMVQQRVADIVKSIFAVQKGK
eukprot:Nk52_evm21s289 gene=Nk52_evmTU21s289